jgi:hypothetical protein
MLTKGVENDISSAAEGLKDTGLNLLHTGLHHNEQGVSDHSANSMTLRGSRTSIFALDRVEWTNICLPDLNSIPKSAASFATQPRLTFTRKPELSVFS